jgi:taurine dioxygenase
MNYQKLTPEIGAIINDVNLNDNLNEDAYNKIYEILIESLVIIFKKTNITNQNHIKFAENFGNLDEPHHVYPHVKDYKNIVLLENDENNPPDTNSWHTDLTFKINQPFASVLVARAVPDIGGDTLWSSCYSAYNRLPNDMKKYLENLKVIHDFGDFRNSLAKNTSDEEAIKLLNENVHKFGHNIRPIIGIHPITKKKYLNFNESFSSYIIGLTINESNSLKTFLTNHMNKPEDQMRWKWSTGDMVMWDNRVTMHYAVSDYMPNYRCMNRITVVNDIRANKN